VSRTHQTALALAAAAGTLAGVPALANDSTAAIGAGGLQLIESYAVELVREDLTIGSDKVTVRYVFRNTSEDDIETLVGFPMPAIDMRQSYESDLGQLSSDTPNYMDFTVTANGAAVEPSVESRATVIGHDVTARLQELGLPVTGFDLGIFDTLGALPAETRAELEAEGIAQFDEYEGDVESYPTWTFQTIFYWTQAFPAGAETVIEHSYTPVVGWQFFGPSDADAIHEGQPTFWDGFCMDDATIDAAVEKAGETYLLTTHVDYILVTARNWLGPIGTFHLTIDKGDPERLVATCMDGLEETGPTSLELTATDFVPAEDLDILLIDGTPAQ
jgi:hypothetical protein